MKEGVGGGEVGKTGTSNDSFHNAWVNVNDENTHTRTHTVTNTCYNVAVTTRKTCTT